MNAGNVVALSALNDDEIEAAVSEAALPALMAALAVVMADDRLLAFDEPDTKLVNHFPAPHGGMPPEEQARARELCRDALIRLRDEGPAGPADDPDRVDRSLELLQKFLMGRGSSEHRDLMRRELGITDADRPDWTIADYPAAEGFRVAVVGAGVAGLAAAHRLKQLGVDLTIFDEQDEVGGVWWQSKYPGCRLDTDNLAYSLSFAQTPTWAHQFSTRDDILSYLQRFAVEHGLREHIAFRTRVTRAEYDAAAGTWDVTTEQGGQSTVTTFDAVVAACGQLNRPVVPDLPGLDSFVGQAFHTAQWPDDLDLTGKNVVVVGTGASAYQVVPAIADQVKTLTVFQRSAPWMSPTPAYHEPIPAGNKALMTSVPGYLQWLRLFQFWNAVEGRLEYARVAPGWTDPGSVSPANQALRDVLAAHIRAQFAERPELAELAIPAYPPYGKRMLRDNGVWARALTLDHVRVESAGVAAVEPTCVVSAAGSRHEADVIVFATGFDASNFLAGLDVVGEGGTRLHDFWDGEPRAYFGVAVPQFPNFFLSLGPNTGFVANGSVIFLAESAARYVVGVLRSAFERGSRTVAPSMRAFEAFNEGLDDDNRGMAWGAEQSSNWYKNSSGRVTLVWPRPILEYWRATSSVRTGDHVYGNPTRD